MANQFVNSPFIGSADLGDVNSVTNSDGTLTISPTTGNVVASLALGHANTWTADQTFNQITISGNVSSPAWTTAGVALSGIASTYTDTTSSGTVSVVATNVFATPTLAASNATTFTTASTLYIAGAPTAGANVTITNALALHIASGNMRINGQVGVNVTPAAVIHAALSLSSAAWGTNGIGLRMGGVTFTDTSSSGTVSNAMINVLSGVTIAASNPTTFTTVATLYIAGPPSAGSNVTITNAFSLITGSGLTQLGGSLGIGAAPSAVVHLALNLTANAWGTAGIGLRCGGNTFTDNSTAGSGTASFAAIHAIATPTLAATNASVTTTDAATFYINNAPTAGGNQTITRAWSQYIAAGNTAYLNGISAFGTTTLTNILRSTTVFSGNDIATSAVLANYTLTDTMTADSASGIFVKSITGTLAGAFNGTRSLSNGGTIVGTNAVLAFSGSSGTTTALTGFRSQIRQTGAGTLTNGVNFAATDGTNAGTYTNQFGYYCFDLTVGTNNYGFYSAVTSGTNKFAFYGSGTAASLVNGDFKLGTAGNGYYVKEGTNATMGVSGAMTAGTITISTTKVTASSRIFLTIQSPGGTPGAVYISARSAGTSFTITSTSGTDTSTVAWLIVEPA